MSESVSTSLVLEGLESQNMFRFAGPFFSKSRFQISDR